jgi:tetratricopeptide (TPR) repeat protein
VLTYTSSVGFESWLDRADWSRRSPDFGTVREYDDWRRAVVMEFRPAEHGESAEWLALRDVWLDLPIHPNALDAMDRDRMLLLLRYAALHWNHPPIILGMNLRARATFAAWGAQVTDVFQKLLAEVPESDLGQLLRPFVKIDLGNAARVGFLPVLRGDAAIAVELPPETLGARTRWDERAFVYVIGKAVYGLCTGTHGQDAAQLNTIIERCLQKNPAKRYRTLEDLQTAWKYAGATEVVREGNTLASWQLAEEGVGWLALGDIARAQAVFVDALPLDKNSRVAAAGLRRAFGLAEGLASRDSRAVPHRQELAWVNAIEKGLHLEAERAFSEALALYRDVRLDGAHDAAIYTAIARCELALGAAGIAIDFAQRALAVDASRVEALSIRARGYLLNRKPQDALKCADVWVAGFSFDAAARYVRGRALFALGRFAEARDAFDRACSLQPGMVEAMLLRREADRAMKRIRETVGAQPEMDLELPEHLAELRGALVGGRIDDMIPVLERPEYDEDAVAKLLHAQCLAFEKRFEDAVAMFDRAAQLSSEHAHAAALGKAHALLALDRAAEALLLFDRARAAAPGDLEALDGRALALRKLGRDAEADDDLRRVTAASGGRSDLRVGRRWH